MKTKKKKEQFEIAKVLFEMGMDFDVIENISGISPSELLLLQANLVDFEKDDIDNKKTSNKNIYYIESASKGYFTYANITSLTLLMMLIYNFYFRIDNKHTPHGVVVYPQAASFFPFSASVLAVKGDPIADLQEDLAAEQKARAQKAENEKKAKDTTRIEPRG